MIELTMISWQKGLKVFSLIDAIKTYSAGSLSAAKMEVEKFLSGQKIILKFDSEEKLEAFKKIATTLGVAFDERIY